MLESEDGASVELAVLGYQYPHLAVGPHGDEWDSNWLIISGRVRTRGGRRWSFRDPGLTTWEVADVVGWLERAARGEVAHVPAWTHETQDDADHAALDDEGGGAATGLSSWWDELHENGWMVFVEPCLSLAVAEPTSASTDGAIRLLVGLGAEWAPPPHPEQASAWRYVELRLTTARIERAAAQLRQDLDRFPRR